MADQNPTNGDSNGSPHNTHETGRVPSSRSARRGPAPQACTECRRLKLRCNRQSPCATCLKRGVSDRCTGATPSDATADPASMLLAAATSTVRELQDRNKSLESHIVELQQAILDVLHGDVSIMKPEHVLHSELLELKRKNAVGACIDKSEMQTQMMESFGTLTISNNSENTSWLGSTASSEAFLAIPEGGKDFGPDQYLDCSIQGLPAEILLLGRIFVFSPTPGARAANTRAGLKAAAPPKEVARRLCDNYFTYGAWLCSPISRTEFFEETFEPLYEAETWSPFTYDRIALLFAVLSVGVLLDLQLPPRHMTAYRFHKICGGSLGMSEFMESPSITSCQTIAMIALFHYMSDDPDGVARSWAMTGMLLRMAQSTGLHRKTSLFEQNPKEHRRRARLWWEVAFFDRIQSLFYGRPSGINNAQCDCPLPEEDPEEPNYKPLRHGFIDTCIAPIIEQSLAVKPPTYAAILKLDKLVRDFNMPDAPTTEELVANPNLSLALQNFTLQGYREMALLHLHRSGFIVALREHAADPLKHKYAPSVLVVHKSASIIIVHLSMLLQQYSILIPRLFKYALNSFSAAILLSALVTHSPGCHLAPSALSTLDIACMCFEQCKDNVRMSTALPIVLKFRNMARNAFAKFKAGQDSRPTELEQEQLARLSGASHVIYSNNKNQEGSPDSSDQSSIFTPDLHSTLQEHFHNLEWEGQQYDPLNVMGNGFNPQAKTSEPIVQEAAEVDSITLEYFQSLSKGSGGGQLDFSGIDLSGFSSMPGLAPGQLPMPLDGVNYNSGLTQEQQVDDPLDFLSKQPPMPTFTQSWDYEA